MSLQDLDSGDRVDRDPHTHHNQYVAFWWKGRGPYLFMARMLGYCLQSCRKEIVPAGFLFGQQGQDRSPRSTSIMWIPLRNSWYRGFDESFGPYWRLHLKNVGLKLHDTESIALYLI